MQLCCLQAGDLSVVAAPLWCSSSVCRQVACLWLLLRYSWNEQMPLDDMNGHLSSDITTHEKMQDTLT